VDAEQANAEHGIQMGLIKAARDALKSQSRDADAILSQLCEYTQMHFLSEQLLMRISARPDAEEHAAEHKKFLEDLSAVSELVDMGEAEAAEQRLRNHEREVLDHICSWDRSI
jgi:hemerythrin